MGGCTPWGPGGVLKKILVRFLFILANQSTDYDSGRWCRKGLCWLLLACFHGSMADLTYRKWARKFA